MSNKAKKAKVDDDVWGDDAAADAPDGDGGDEWGDEPAPDEKKKPSKSAAVAAAPAKKKVAAAAADDEVEGWGDDDNGGGWDDNDDDDDGGADDASAASSSAPAAPKMVGVKLHLAMSKSVLLAIRQKKTTTSAAHRDAASDVLQELYRDYEADLADRVAERKVREAKAKKAGTAATVAPAKAPAKAVAAKKASTGPRTSCSICFNPFGDTGDSSAAIMSNCGHFTGCVGCFREWISTKIREKTVTPWLNCAEEDCTAAIHPDDMVSSGLSTLLMLQFGEVYTAKHLARNENFVPCSLEGCGFGFLVEGKKPPKVEMTCQVCTKRQLVEKKEILDAEFKKWIEEGKMKPCPACGFLIMKEYGICNVINCGKCGIWWNWATKETGRDSRELKERARANGTLWQPGELAFQQDLERRDPKAFKELLERNGMKFDPNYRRGT